MGADEVFDLSSTTPAERLERLAALTGGQLADVVIEAAGSAAAIEEGPNLARNGGRYVIVGAGVLFGSHPFVKKNFELVIVAIVVISVIPMVVEFVRAKMAAKRGGSAVVEATTIGRSEP